MRISAVLALSLLALAPLPTLAQQTIPSPAQQEIVREKFWLAHQNPNKLLILLFGDLKGQPKSPRILEWLYENGMAEIKIASDKSSLILKGTRSAIENTKRGLLVADVEVVYPNQQRKIILLTPKRLKPQELSERAMKLPGAGVTQVRGEQVAIDGNPEWVDEATRLAIRAEISDP